MTKENKEDEVLAITAFDDAIEESVNKLINAKTGTEIRTFIVEFEELMSARTKYFTQMIMQEQRDEENKTKAQTAQVAKSSNPVKETLNSIRNKVYTGESVEAEGVMTADNIHTDSLTRGEVYRRTADALLSFIERVACGHGSTRTPEAEAAALPDAARVLLEVSRQLPTQK